MKNNGDGTHTVHYTPAQDGPYTVAVKYAEQEVPHRYSRDEEPEPWHCVPICLGLNLPDRLARFERARFIKFSAPTSLFCSSVFCNYT